MNQLEESALRDLFTNGPDVIDTVNVLGSLGNGDHIMLPWTTN